MYFCSKATNFVEKRKNMRKNCIIGTIVVCNPFCVSRSREDDKALKEAME